MANIQTKSKLNPTLIGILLLLLGACGVTAFLWFRHWDLSGNDVWGHLYKSQYLFHSIQEGNWYPLYSPDWYNGIQIYRYWPPMAYYCMAFFLFLTNGSILHAYYLYAGFVFFFGGLPFLLLGRKLNRPVPAMVLSYLWFFLPDNIRVYLCEGNLPRILTTVILPYIIFFLWTYIREHKRFAMIGLMLCMTLLTVTHLMLTAIIGIGTFFFLCFDAIHNRTIRQDMEALAAMLIGIAIAGIWFIPAVSGGMLSMGDSSSTVQELYSAPLSTSLNLMNRATGVADTIYYGVAIVFVAILGILLANKKHRAGFFLSVVVLLGLTPATISVTKHLPLGNFLWFFRFIALSYGFFFLSFLEWTSLKKKYSILLTVLLAVDCFASVLYIPRYYQPTSPAIKAEAEVLKRYTTQRANLMDLSNFGSYPSWDLSTGEDAIDYSYGWAWQGASTSQNIMLMNEALEHQQYVYVFDRSIELGDDTVLVTKASTVNHTEELLSAAELCGYELVTSTDLSYIFKKNTPASFGVRSEYPGLAIGQYANTLSIYFPAFTVGTSNYIDDYSPEELSRYETLFLSGFDYHNQETAETLLRAVSERGTRVVIDGAHIPENAYKEQTFLNVNESQITFTQTLPALHYGGETIVTGTIPSDDGQWKTGYINDAGQVLGSIVSDGQTLPFFSQDAISENIYYLGMNLAYYAIETGTENTTLWNLLSDCLRIHYETLPTRELVPISIAVDPNENTITIQSEQPQVNTTLAYQDNFVSDTPLYNENHMLVMDGTSAMIQIVYPHLYLGLLVSICGVLLGIGMMIYLFRKQKT